jgi:hypothetical protein
MVRLLESFWLLQTQVSNPEPTLLLNGIRTKFGMETFKEIQSLKMEMDKFEVSMTMEK